MSSPFVTPVQALQFYDKYSRFNHDLGRRETWPETVGRVMSFFRQQTHKKGKSLPDETWQALSDAMLNLEAMPSMRIVQMAGPALERCNVGAYNCAYLPIDSLEAYGELLYVLMQGTGCGFSVEVEYVSDLPKIKRQKGEKPHKFIVPDTTEGWCNALVKGLKAWSEGEDVAYDFSRIRPQGTVLKTKGGRASGPEPLKRLLSFAREKLLARQGRRLTTLEAHDIACYCGDIVQVGGVRRAAEISLSDLDDRDMRDAKAGQFWLHNVQRAMANNSAVYEDKPSAMVFMEEWLALMKSGTGERGIFNRGGVRQNLPKRRKKRDDFGVNPCGEIILRPRQFCVAGDTPLITRTGVTRIAEAVGSEIEIWNGVNWSKVRPFRTGEANQLIRVTFSDGTHLDCTPDHKFSVSTFATRNTKTQWRTVNACDLRPRMATPTVKISHGSGSELPDAYTLGFAVGDGNMDKNNAVMIDLYGAKIACPVIGVRGSEVTKHGYRVPCVRVATNLDETMWLDLVLEDEKAWRSLFGCTKESILQFMAGWADSDGSTASNGIRIYSTKVNALKWGQLLLLKCGIRSSLNWMSNEDTNFGRRNRPMWYLQITDCADVPCHRLDTSKGKTPPAKGKYQTVRSVEKLDGLHETFCFTEPERHMGVFNATLTFQCNLSIAVARPSDTVETLMRKVELAATFGTLQSLLTDFRFLPEDWKKNCDEERLLGVDITGQMDCPLLRPGGTQEEVETRRLILQGLALNARNTNWALAKEWGINQSASVTCIKPSGNSAQLFNCSSGLHPRYAKYYLRRLRIGAYTPIAKLLKDQQVPFQPEVGQRLEEASVLVFEFPIKAPDGAPTRHDMSALDQLDNWLDLKTCYTEHNPSVTIYVDEHEWLSVGAWVYEHFDQIGGLSFLPKDGGQYELAPYEEISEAEYTKRAKALPTIDFGQLSNYEKDDMTEINREFACSGDKCEV